MRILVQILLILGFTNLVNCKCATSTLFNSVSTESLTSSSLSSTSTIIPLTITTTDSSNNMYNMLSTYKRAVETTTAVILSSTTQFIMLCNSIAYNSSQDLCCDNTIVPVFDIELSRCCGNGSYDISNELCCVDSPYNPKVNILNKYYGILK